MSVTLPEVTFDASRPQRRARRDLLLAFVAPVILTVVALGHQVLTATHDLNPWKGGGFGMFATVDSPGTRTIYTLVTRQDGSVFDTSKPFGAFNRNDSSANAIRTATFPDDSSLRKMADGVLSEYTLFVDDPATPDDDAVAVTVEIHSIEFDSTSSTATSTLVRSITVDAS